MKSIVESMPISSVKCVRSDNGGEFTSKEFGDLLLSHNVKHEKSAPYSPHQNGTAERAWRSIFEMARCLLVMSELPKFMWTYAVMASTYIRNRCYNPRLEKTPMEAFSGRKPNISHMHVFGSVCYALVQSPKKLDARAQEGVFVGYDRGSPAYLVYFPENQEVKRVRCVKFPKLSECPKVSDCKPGQVDVEHEFIDREPLPEPQPAVVVEAPEPELQIADDNIDNVGDEPVLPPVGEIEHNGVAQGRAAQGRYPIRERARPTYLDEYVSGDEIDDVNCMVDYCSTASGVPKTYQEAIVSADSSHWKKAMENEMSALEENETYKLTPLPQGRKVVGGRWVYALKNGLNNQEQYKARYVAKGYSQLPDIDFGETFSPTARITSIRTLMQLAVQFNLNVHQMDVKAAFLNAPIDCELYVEQPKGFEQTGAKGEKLVCKLNRSLYGLKQSGRNWNNLLHSHLVEQGFEQSAADHCVYTRQSGNELTIVIIWVDDIIIASTNDPILMSVKKSLSQRFKMKDLGPISWFLGVEFIRRDNTIMMTQQKYIEGLLYRFQMQDCKPRSTPCDVGKANILDSELADVRLYREMVGSLIYVMTATRPDLCYVVTRLSQHMVCPTVEHLTMAKHVLR